MSEIKTHFPQKIKTFVEPFVGGGSVFLNVEAERYLLNDIDSWVIGIHQYLCAQSGKEAEFFQDLFNLIDQYGLSCSYRNNVVPAELRKSPRKLILPDTIRGHL